MVCLCARHDIEEAKVVSYALMGLPSPVHRHKVFPLWIMAWPGLVSWPALCCAFGLLKAKSYVRSLPDAWKYSRFAIDCCSTLR